MISIVIIFHGSFLDSIVDVDIIFCWYLVKLEIFSVDFVATVWRVIVGDNSEVVRVVLSEN
jgi:hypothetical protein